MFFQTNKDDIHQVVIKIGDYDIFYDFQLNTTESVIVGTNRQEVLENLQRGFENQYNQYGRLKKEDIKTLDYETSLRFKEWLKSHLYCSVNRWYKNTVYINPLFNKEKDVVGTRPSMLISDESPKFVKSFERRSISMKSW